MHSSMMDSLLIDDFLGLMGNPLPAEIFTLYTESNGLQKLLTYFLDSLPSSLHGRKQILSFDFVLVTNRHEFLSLSPTYVYLFIFLGNRFFFLIILLLFLAFVNVTSWQSLIR